MKNITHESKTKIENNIDNKLHIVYVDINLLKPAEYNPRKHDIEIACSKAGVSRMTFYRWKKQDVEFAKEVDEAMALGKSLISDVAESQLIAAIKKGDMRGIIFWLKHNREEYKTKVELSGTLLQIREDLTDDEVEILRQALELAGFDDSKINEIQNHEPGKTELSDLSRQA